MKPRIPYRWSMSILLVCLLFGLSAVGCKASQLTSNGTEIVLLYDEPAGCENLGVVIGRGGGLTGAYSKPSVIRESAENQARNEAAKKGATHLFLHPEQLDQGDGRGPSEQDTAPAMAHGSGTGSTVTVAGTALAVHYQVRQGWQNLNLDTVSFAWMIALAVFATVLPLYLVAEGVRLVGAQRASIASTVGPPATAAMAILLLGETVSAGQLAGIALIVGSILALELRRSG